MRLTDARRKRWAKKLKHAQDLIEAVDRDLRELKVTSKGTVYSEVIAVSIELDAKNTWHALDRAVYKIKGQTRGRPL